MSTVKSPLSLACNQKSLMFLNGNGLDEIIEREVEQQKYLELCACFRAASVSFLNLFILPHFSRTISSASIQVARCAAIFLRPVKRVRYKIVLLFISRVSLYYNQDCINNVNRYKWPNLFLQ